MKGVMFRVLEKMVVTRLGADAWETLLHQTTLQTPWGGYVGPASYPDEDLLALVNTASAMTGRTVAELLRAYGRFAFAELARMVPGFISAGLGAKAFLLSVDRVIHVEVRKLHAGANLPYFCYEDPGPDRLVMLYESPRGLCDVTSGLIDGTGDYFSEDIEQVHAQCKQKGHSQCRFELRFRARAG